MSVAFAMVADHELRRSAVASTAQERVLLEDGRQVEGWLEAWREDRDGWRGWVYTTGLAENRLDWFDSEHMDAQ